MHDFFNLSAPWWMFVLRAIVIYLLVMVLIRVSGKRAVGQFTPFDLVLLILIGNAVQNGLGRALPRRFTKGVGERSRFPRSPAHE